MRIVALLSNIVVLLLSCLVHPVRSFVAAAAAARGRGSSRNNVAGCCLHARRMQGSVYIATTLDGKIADPSGSVSFLDDYQQQSTDDGDMGFGDFLASVDVIIMGRKSFEKVVSFGADMWAYGTTPVVVWSRSGLQVPDHLKETVSWSNLSPREIFKEMEAKGRSHAYIDGGFTVQSFLQAGLVDTLILTRVPLILGPGIPLFSDENRCKLEHVNTQAFSNGLVQSTYRVLK